MDFTAACWGVQFGFCEIKPNLEAQDSVLSCASDRLSTRRE
jgi:hypothetical protein